MGLEYELKYAAAPVVLQAIKADFGVFSPISMGITYFDTADHTLSAQKITLRCRLENGISVCTLKTPGVNGARGEWEVQSPWSEAAVQQLFQQANVPAVSFHSLAPVCGAKFTRLAKTVALPECSVEIALDEGVLLGSGKEIPLCEVEVEMKSGSKDAAFRWATDLARKYDLQEEPLSKFKRALALAKGE